ncbi:MAG: nucleotidyltransferase domain-containing protein [Thermofilaceae archaeon]
MRLDLNAVVARLAGVLAGYGDLVLYAVIFGSLARGTPRVDSDIDVGLRPKPRQAGKLLEALPELTVEVADCLGLPIDRVDLALLDVEKCENLSFLYEALAHGFLVWGDAEAYAEDLARIASLYADHLVQLRKLDYLSKYAEAYARCAGSG